MINLNIEQKKLHYQTTASSSCIRNNRFLGVHPFRPQTLQL